MLWLFTKEIEGIFDIIDDLHMSVLTMLTVDQYSLESLFKHPTNCMDIYLTNSAIHLNDIKLNSGILIITLTWKRL